MTVSAAAAFIWMRNKYSELATMAHGQLELGAAALLNAVLCGMRLASLLTHLF